MEWGIDIDYTAKACRESPISCFVGGEGSFSFMDVFGIDTLAVSSHEFRNPGMIFGCQNSKVIAKETSKISVPSQKWGGNIW